MGKKLYVGNLPFTATDAAPSDFRTGRHSRVCEGHYDRDTGRSKGFGLWKWPGPEATDAITRFNGADLEGRAMTVNEARPMVPRDNRGGGGGGGRGFGGGGGHKGGGGGGGRRDRW